LFYRNKIMSQQSVMSWTDFQKTLDIYKKNYIRYSVSGNDANKQAYESAQQALDETLTNLRAQVDTNQDMMTSFKDDYTSELDRLHQESQLIQKKGPEIQDEYIRIKKIKENEHKDSLIPYMVKAVLIAGLIGVAMVAGR